MLRIDLSKDIVSRLVAEYGFKERGEHLREGLCPQCDKKTLWTWKLKPGMVQCNRTNHCGWNSKSRDLFPDLFEDLNKKYKATEQDPTKTADAYIELIRGFDVDKIKGWYEQGKYWHPHGNKGTATVLFFLDPEKTIMWERLIDDVTIKLDDGSKETRNKNFKGSFRGLWWQPPGFEILDGDRIYLCEGILDAIALNLSGFKAVAIMSSGTFPETSLLEHKDKEVKWLFALDNDKSGKLYTAKHVKKLASMGFKVGAVFSSATDVKTDWNDLYRLGKLSESDMRYYRHLGKVELAKSANEKCMHLWDWNPKKTFFCFTYSLRTYSFKIDFKEYEKAKEKIENMNPDKPLYAKREAFTHASTIKEIATFEMQFPATGKRRRRPVLFPLQIQQPRTGGAITLYR